MSHSGTPHTRVDTSVWWWFRMRRSGGGHVSQHCGIVWVGRKERRPPGARPREGRAPSGRRLDLRSVENRRPTKGCRAKRQIVRTRAETQRIVATRPLCRVHHPVPYSSRLQVIHRAGSGNCDARGSCNTCAHGCPRTVNNRPSGMDSNLEAFSYNPADGSFAASPFPAAAIPMI